MFSTWKMHEYEDHKNSIGEWRSPADLNEHLRTVIVAPMTSKGFRAPFRIPVTHAGKKGVIVLDKIRAVDKIRLVQRVGAVQPKTLSNVLNGLQELFAQ